MANQICTADGNLTTLATWAVAEAGASSVQITISSSTNTTTSYVYSSAFTVTNLDVIDGFLLHCKRVNTTGTISVTLSEDNGVTATREVTVNASDLPSDQCWFFFKFASTLTGDGGADYKVGIKGSSAGNATFYRDGTAGNWGRVLRTTANPGALAAGDNFYIAGEWTAAATTTVRSVTMNAIAGSITDFGTLDIGQGGTLIYGASASTDYYLRLSGDLNVWSGGTLSIGTTGTPIPATSTAKLNLDCGSNVQYGLIIRSGATFNGQGASKTVSAMLAADIAINATSLTTNISTSWVDNDEIAVASTTRTNTQCEKGTLNGNASGTSLTVDGFGGAGGGVAYAHSGTSPTQAEIINLTRNVKIFGASATLQTYILIENATVDLDYAEFYWLGSGTTNKRGINIQITSNSFNAQYCAFHDFKVASSVGLLLSGTNYTNTTASNNVFFDIANHYFNTAGPSSGTWTFSGNICMLNPGSHGCELLDVGGTFTNNTIVGTTGAAYGIRLAEGAALGTFTGITVHSCGNAGISFDTYPTTEFTLNSFTVWRNGSSGISFNATSASLENAIISSSTLFGNATSNIQLDYNAINLKLISVTLNGDTSFATTNGLVFSGQVTVNCTLDQCNFGTASGIKTTHSTSDISISNSVYCTVITRNTILASTTEINNLVNTSRNSYVRNQRLDGTAGNHISYFQMGTISVDTTIYNTASPSERLTPSSASTKLESSPKNVTVLNTATKTFSVNVRKSAVGDGAAYNGSEPRLILRKNPAVGINADVVLDTMSVAVGNWETLSGTSAAANDDGVLEAYVDCDGTAGWINVDDWSA